MKFIQRLENKRFAQLASRLLKYVCYFVICFYTLCMVLSFMGRQSFFLHTSGGTFEGAVYAEENHDYQPHGMTVQTGDNIHVWTNATDKIDLTIHIGLSLMYAVHIAPMVLGFWFLSRVFSNIQKGQIFTEANSAYLFYYGALQFSVAVFVPIIKLFVCWLVNLVSDGRMSLSTGQASLGILISSIAFMVAACIIHYGVHLQDEVDHTL